MVSQGNGGLLQFARAGEEFGNAGTAVKD